MTLVSTSLRLVSLAALALATTAAHAAIFLTENFAASLNGDATLGGVALGSTTEFSFQATFDADPAANLHPEATGFGMYPISTLSITIAGHGTYSATLETPLVIMAIDPSYSYLPYNFPGLYDGSTGILAAFNTTTPALDAHAPSPTVFSDFLGLLGNNEFTIGLSGVPGGLVVPYSGVSGPVTASFDAVPEPATYAIVAAGGLLAFAGWRRR